MKSHGPPSLRFCPGIAAAMVVACVLLCQSGCVTNSDRATDRDAPLSTAAERDKFHELLLKALDREALYTLVGGLKPLSTGLWRAELDIEQPDTAEIVRVRRVLALLRDDTYYADVQAFATAHDGKRHVEAYVVHLASFAAMIEREREFWSPLGVTPCTHPAEVVAIVDRLPRADRWRAYGLLFGYPKYAIEFFVEAGERATANGTEVGPGKDREFFHVPTASAPEGQFTWAVPIGHVERAEDRAIRTRAEAVLSAYRRAAPSLAVEHDPLSVLRRLNAMLVGSDDRPVARMDEPAGKEFAKALAFDPPSRDGTLHLLSFGVGAPMEGPPVDDLYGRDAGFVVESLKRSPSAWKRVEATFVSGLECTPKRLLTELERLERVAQPGDLVFIHASTHGTTKDGVLRLDSDKDFIIDANTLAASLARLPCPSLVTIDTCQAGGALRSSLPKQSAWLLGCSETQSTSGQVDNPKSPHGFVVIAMCEALRGHADSDRDGMVTVGELCGWVPKRASELARDIIDQDAVVVLPDEVATLPLTRVVKNSAYGRLSSVWSVEHVEVFATNGATSLPEEQSTSLRGSWSRTDRTNSLLREQKLTILHTLNADGTYTHTLDWADSPERRFEESGTWTIDSAGVIRCVNNNAAASSLPEARVLHLDDGTLIVRMDFTGAASGQSEIIRHRLISAASNSTTAEAPSPH